ncbi:MAG TPA: carbohydrate kinase family protein [Chloroflexi bacterium]|jgi:sugar/nucleoside kinase (ribokinase family)|nr:carbohydrate kinase family protein [Chloroflexota bacterium]
MEIVGLGLATLDVLLRLKDMPTWERPGALGDFSFDGGGPVGTACVAASRLGARVGYVGTAGNDQLAELKLKSLTENGVDISRIAYRDAPETQVVMVYVHEETGERVFGGARRNIPRNEPLRVDELDREYITSAQYLHLDGTHFEAAMQAIEWMHEAGKEVCIDCAKTDGRPVPQHLADLVPHVDILICGSGFGYSLTGHKDIWKAGEAMLAMGPRIVVQTEGSDGSYTTTADERFHTPIIDVPVIDTTGAGDVFHGAYLVGLLHGWDLRSVAWFSTAVSAIKCTKLGGRRGIPCYDDVMALLRERGIEMPE